MIDLHRRAALALALCLSFAAGLAPVQALAAPSTVPSSIARSDGTAVDVQPVYQIGPDGSYVPPGSVPASGVAPVTASLTATGNTSAFPAVAGRPININITGSATGLSARTTRSFDNGATWLPLTINGQPWAVWTGNVSEQAWVETEANIQFRVEVTAIAGGTATIRISQ